jgi:serine/threonine-protein kinase
MPMEHEGNDPLIGQIVGGRYRVTGVLGEGGMGIVYVGEQQMGSTVRKVAIKTLHSHLSKDPSVLARFHRECGTVAQLEHPNTIKFYDFGATEDGTLYIAMEFVKGEPLSDALQNGGAMPPDRVVRILRQVCGALDEAHALGIIHRDLKPDNIVLAETAGQTDFVKVLDFGIAARSESADAQKEQKLTQQGMVLGTPPYMSPEQFTGKALDGRSDVYSLGVMAYEMLTGKLPFEADTPWQWATEHMTAQPRPFEITAPTAAIPAHMRGAILRSLAKDREQRQTSAKEFFGELSGGSPMMGASATAGDAAAVSGSAATAAMPAAPVFAPVAAPTYSAATPPGSALPIPAPRPPPARSGKGLILALASVGGVLLIAIAVVAARSLREPSADPLPTPLNPLSDAGVAHIEPEIEAGAQPSPLPSLDAGTTQETARAPVPSPPRTSTGPKEPDKPKADSCDACIAAASSGNFSGAARAFSSCGDTGKKNQCLKIVRRQAPGTAKTLALNGDCAKAQAIVSAAEAIGAGSAGLKAAVKTCQ